MLKRIRFMKSLIVLSVVGMFAADPVQAHENFSAHKEVVPVCDLQVSGEFASTDDVTVIATGVFANGCYRLKDPRVTHLSNREHLIEVIAIVHEGMCPMVLLPFRLRINLGKLERGAHLIRAQNGNGTTFDQQLVIR